jgi:hypothetical protein
LKYKVNIQISLFQMLFIKYYLFGVRPHPAGAGRRKKKPPCNCRAAKSFFRVLIFFNQSLNVGFGYWFPGFWIGFGSSGCRTFVVLDGSG